MRTILMAAVLAAGLAGCGMKTDTPEDRAQTMATLFNKTKGLTAGAMADDLSARAEGKIMVLTFKNAMEDGVTISPEDAKAAITPLICNDKNYTKIIDDGVGIRVEMFSKGGQAVPPVTVESCPGQPGPKPA